MDKCEICGKPQEDDLFSAATGARVCSVCTFKFIDRVFITTKRINEARKKLCLSDGEYLMQDNPAEATRVLGR